MASIETGEKTFVNGGNSGTVVQLVALAGGKSLIVWVGATPSGGYEAFGKVLDAQGVQVGGSFQLSQSSGSIVGGFDTAKVDDGHVAIVFNASLPGGGSAPIRAAVFDPVAMANGAAAPASFLVATPDEPYSNAGVAVIDGDLAFLWRANGAMGGGNAYGTVLDAQTHAVVTAETLLFGVGSYFQNVVASDANTLVIAGADQNSGFVQFLNKDFTFVDGGVVSPNSNQNSYAFGNPEPFANGVIASHQNRGSIFGDTSYDLQVIGDHVTGLWAPQTPADTSIVPYVVGDKIVAVFGHRAQVLSYGVNVDGGTTQYVFSEEGPEFTIDSNTYPDDIVATGTGFLAVWREGASDRDIVGQYFTTGGTETGLLTSGDYGGELEAGGTQSLTGNLLSNDVPDSAGGTIVTHVGGTAVGTSTAIVGTYGTLTISSNGSFSFKADRPAAIALTENDTAQESFTYRARSTDGDDDTAQITFNIDGVFDGGARNVALTSNTVVENGGAGSEVGQVTFEGEETFSYELVGNVGKPFAIDQDGEITTTAALDREAHASYTVTVKLTGDRSHVSTTKDFVITVTDVNEAPGLPAFTTSYAKDHNDFYQLTTAATGRIGSFSAIDPEGDAVTYTISAQAYGGGQYPTTDKFTIVGNELRVSGTLPQDFYYLSINAQDGSGHVSATTYVNVRVSSPPQPPVISSNGGGTSATVTVNENATAVTTVSASQFPGYSIVGGADAAKFQIDYGTGKLTFKAAPNFEAPTDTNKDNAYEVKVRATSGDLFDEQTLSVKVADVNEFAPVIGSNGGAASASVSVLENVKTVTTVKATDADKSASLAYSITGGADKALFTINAATGALAFKTAPNFELPTDAGKNNVYDVVVTASDGSKTDTQAIAVKVGNVNEFAPVIGSNGGAATASVTLNEGVKAVTTVKATDADAGASLSYALSGGADKALFALDAKTGALTFKAAPDFEAPKDAGKNNVYDVIVSASDGTKIDTQAIAVKIKDVGGPNKLVADARGETFVFHKEGGGKTGLVSHEVSGFTAGLDRIDLSGIDADAAPGDQALRFVTNFAPAKAGQPDGQVRAVDHGRDVAVEIDWDGNGAADMVLQVLDVARLSAGDFLL